MTKKNRNRLRNRDREHTTTSSSTITTPVQSSSRDASSQHTAEYQVITKDMIRLIVLNGAMLIAVIALYYSNRSTGYLERFFEKFL